MIAALVQRQVPCRCRQIHRDQCAQCRSAPLARLTIRILPTSLTSRPTIIRPRWRLPATATQHCPAERRQSSVSRRSAPDDVHNDAGLPEPQLRGGRAGAARPLRRRHAAVRAPRDCAGIGGGACSAKLYVTPQQRDELWVYNTGTRRVRRRERRPGWHPGHPGRRQPVPRRDAHGRRSAARLGRQPLRRLVLDHRRRDRHRDRARRPAPALGMPGRLRMETEIEFNRAGTRAYLSNENLDEVQVLDIARRAPRRAGAARRDRRRRQPARHGDERRRHAALRRQHPERRHLRGRHRARQRHREPGRSRRSPRAPPTTSSAAVPRAGKPFVIGGRARRAASPTATPSNARLRHQHRPADRAAPERQP